MTQPLHIPPQVTERQNTASNPAVSAWVSANAGSGKTHVLTQRVIRLLLNGVPPEKILCLTFTKAAAANMATRVFNTLGSWTTLDDSALDAAIKAMEGRVPSPSRRRRARRLFAEALETPGGLKVQTIHAFCTALLHQFPFEADVAARFEVMEERASAELIDRLRLDVLQEAAADPDGPLGQALTSAIVAAADVTFADVVREAIAERDILTAWVGLEGDVAAALGRLSKALGLAADATIERNETEFFTGPHLDPSEWSALRAILAGGTSNDHTQARRLADAASRSGSARVDSYVEFFLSKSDSAPRKTLLTKKLADRHPDWAERLSREQARVCDLMQQRRALRLRDRTSALVTIAHAVLSRYRAEKDRAGLLDYDDLIDKTLALLNQGAARWVMYKLDLGIDHLLIDEAQDTSPKQWDVIEKLTEDFTSGAGARGDTVRSIFAVGDEKQSIYSFQGAAPHRFEEMRQHFEKRHKDSAMAFERVPMLHSFRSAPDVLGGVDKVFGRREAYKGLTAESVQTVHQAVRTTAPGCVEVWPLEEPDAREPVEPWDAPFDLTTEQNPRTKLARRIAGTVKQWITHGDAATGARVTPGDVLILVRQRGPLFEAIIRALKDAGVEVAGADRLVLTEHIAIMDLMSLGDALLLREDDLALAEVLKSPLFGFDEDQLFALAHERNGALRDALDRKSAENPAFAAAARELDALTQAARRDSPFAFYARLLGAGGGRRKILARLGLEAADALDEFLALLLEYERMHTPSLQGFLGWLRATPPEVKRDMEVVRDEVRVMTVHGAKGLESQIVVIADTTTKPAGPRDPVLLTLGEQQDDRAPMVWCAARALDVPIVAEARTRARLAGEDEHRRLLYVAMTRAADRLIVCGARGKDKPPEGCWYQLVADALTEEAAEVPAEFGDGTILRWQKSAPIAPPVAAPTAQEAAPAAPAAPSWLEQRAATTAAGARTVTPSTAFGRAGEGARLPQRVLAARAAGRRRGNLIHRLLQALPEIAPNRREAAAARFLAGAKPPIPDDAAAAIIRETLAVLDDPAFAALFAPGSRAEIPVVGRIILPGGRVVPVSGQIDRLALSDGAVLIGDFKTDSDPPKSAEDAPAPYRLQLALYRAVLARLYPEREIRAALVFTQGPRLVAFPAELLDAALADLSDGRLDPPAPHT